MTSEGNGREHKACVGSMLRYRAYRLGVAANNRNRCCKKNVLFNVTGEGVERGPREDQ